ncbi:hypothetical protein [Heliophilum fasciatum]|nr:hypothetical protein [Heliophilum fasciatum]MCW2277572.1 hypothetical protein [Heliophilum fasciatum]
MEFYAKLRDQIRSYIPQQRFKVDTLILKNLKGIGNYKTTIKRIFQEIIRQNPGVSFTVFLCYDTDVFEYSTKPIVNWSEVEKDLKAWGAKKIFHIKAKRSIEDWFLLDEGGILHYLNLSKGTKVSKNGGTKTIETLFKKGGKVYIKGSTRGFVDSLDIKLIMNNICPELKNLCKDLGVKCNDNNRKCT